MYDDDYNRYMKVIKHLKKETPDYRIKVFFKEMPIITKILLLLVCLVSFLLWIVDFSTSPTIFSIFDGRPLHEMLMLLIVGITDFYLEEKKGSIYFLLQFLFKSYMIVGLKILAEYLTADWISMNDTSCPFIFCLSLAFRELVHAPHAKRYFLIFPFQIKAGFYPILLVAILEIFGLRIDVLLGLGIGILFYFLKIETFLLFLSKRIETKIVSDKMVKIGFMKANDDDMEVKEIDRIVTNNSVVLEQ